MQAFLPLTLAAAQLSAWEQLKRVPKDTWINLAICIVAVVVIVSAWRALKKLNDFFPYIAAMLAGLMIFFYWVYERKEPKFLTPAVDALAHFLPTKAKQGDLIDQQRKARQ